MDHDMPTPQAAPDFAQPVTTTVRQAVARTGDARLVGDLLFLEHWEMMPIHGPAAALRVSQIRRANPELAAALREEIARARHS
jgi:hypothetical protein